MRWRTWWRRKRWREKSWRRSKSPVDDEEEEDKTQQNGKEEGQRKRRRRRRRMKRDRGTIRHSSDFQMEREREIKMADAHLTLSR